MPIDTTDFRIELSGITVFDVILIIAVLLLSIGIIVEVKIFRDPPPPMSAEAVVYGDGKELQRIGLYKDKEIALPNGKMILAVEGGKIRVKGSDCHRRMCVHAGFIGSPGETIVCIPNKTVIEITAGGTPGVDAVAF